MLLADVFKSDLFGSTSLTAAINEIPYVPQRLSELDLFSVQGIPTTTAFIEKRGSTLVLVQSSPRGGNGQNVAIDRRDAIPFQCVHLQLDDQIMADEVQNVRSFGTANELLGVQEVRDARLRKMSMSLDLTLEYHKLGAIQGLVVDADNSVIEDLFDKFGIAEPDDVAMNLGAAFNTTSSPAVVLPKITGVLRDVQEELGGFVPSGYLALCGDAYFDQMSSHGELRETVKMQAAMQLREDGRRTFTYGGVTWENYRGVGNVAIDTDEARLIPLGVPDLFQQLFSPADTMEAVNTNGQVKYSFAAPDPSGKNKFIALEAQSNPITFCSRPKVLRRLIRTA